ncbi:Vegetative incompatibility protein HET-E-1 [Colletotrichum aenigma]|uniref:Vegetative incompatibility protein HET-E-1 n=1 Tax=Colletotrichum aenigma TaxID=1215731 RepID=UPI0018727F43|nr:Vegetative incompatibility protein HET-E-1 [Colletotrichum aenigma]KAF5519300.1 Vegetative incompatibility protein HET-E-1 [Colletotrichum aenigma]
MFSWYQTAGRCYANLADVPDTSASTFDNGFRRSRWHTRGWTLQELLAPQDLVFYSQSWTKLGEEASMTSMIEETTGIPARFLGGFRDASVAQRMSWATQRVTTRGEDMAYCLFGIFNVSLPIIDLSLAEDIRKFDRRYGYSIEVPASSKLAVFDVYPKDRWDTRKRFGITGVDFLRDTKQLSWIRLRHNEEQSPDFVVMLELEISSSQPQLTCHLMVASRSMEPDTLAREIPALPSLSRFTGTERASNGWCNLTVQQTTKRQGGYVVYEISFAELERRQIDYLDITSEIELVACDRRLQFLFEEDIQLGPKVNRAAHSVLEKQADIKYKEIRLSSMKKELERLPLEMAESERFLKSLTNQDERIQEKKNGILQSISSLSERLPMGVGVQRLMQWHNSVAQSLSRTLPAQDADIESILDEKIRLFMRAIAIGHLGAMEYLSGQL